MSGRNFMAYEDATSVLSGYADEIKKKPTTFIGTTDEWDALSEEERAEYVLVNLTDDEESLGSDVVDSVSKGVMNPVTSNAVADELSVFSLSNRKRAAKTDISISANSYVDVSLPVDDAVYGIITGVEITGGMGDVVLIICDFSSSTSILVRVRNVSTTTARSFGVLVNYI